MVCRLCNLKINPIDQRSIVSRRNVDAFRHRPPLQHIEGVRRGLEQFDARATAEPRVVIFLDEQRRHAIMDIGNKCVRLSDDNCAGLEPFARLAIFPLVPQTSDCKTRGAIAGRKEGASDRCQRAYPQLPLSG